MNCFIISVSGNEDLEAYFRRIVALPASGMSKMADIISNGTSSATAGARMFEVTLRHLPVAQSLRSVRIFKLIFHSVYFMN